MVLAVLDAATYVHFDFRNFISFDLPKPSDFPYVAFLALCWMLVALILANFVYHSERALGLSLVSDLEKLVFDAYKKRYLIQVSLNNRKCYVGFVHRTIEPRDESAHLTLIPLLSGYREPNNLNLSITHKYKEIIKVSKAHDEEQYPNYQLVIPISEIISCHRFHKSIHEDVKKQTKKKKQPQ